MSDAGTPADRVKAPAVGLLIVGILGIVYGLFSLLNSILGLGFGAAQLEQMREQGQEVPEWLVQFLGGGGLGAMQIAMSLLGIASSAFIAYGGLQMQKLRGRTLCMVASVIAMVPCLSPCCCIGLPVGIWALIVLNKEDVRQAFAP